METVNFPKMAHSEEAEPRDAEFDVVVVGSGAGAMVAALRAQEHGLTCVVVEKAPQYGGTTATSGGCVWIPANDEIPDDTPDAALTYLKTIIGKDADDEALRAFISNGAAVIRHVERYGLKFFSVPGYPDYYSDAPGATTARSMLPHNMDGALLGDDFFQMRDSNAMSVGKTRYALDFVTAAVLPGRLPGWRRAALSMLARYWSDIGWRRKTRRDRLLVMGRALIGPLRKAMRDRAIPLWLNTELVGLEKQHGRVSAALCRHRGEHIRIGARRAVILTAGGYEQNQEMRDKFMPIPVNQNTSLTPHGGNTGDAIRIGHEAGGALAGMSQVWWAPCVRLPLELYPNVHLAHGLIFERGRPHSMIVNRRGKRYTNEACSYDRFGLAMIEEEKRTGAANPSWMIFDASFRKKNSVGGGGLLPSWIMPDRRVPREWWDNVIYRSDSLAGLASKIGVPRDALEASVEEMNRFARTGVDERFGRGSFAYDQFLGEQGWKPNSSLGPIETGPFYAVPVDLGDLGTKGGLKVNGSAQVLDKEGRTVDGLYAVGNTACSLFGNTYPGAGATLGPAMTFGFLASEHIAHFGSSDLVSTVEDIAL